MVTTALSVRTKKLWCWHIANEDVHAIFQTVTGSYVASLVHYLLDKDFGRRLGCFLFP